MREEGLAVIKPNKARKYCSYKGEITDAPKDLVKRDFHASLPDKIWLTDMTEFALPKGRKVPLSFMSFKILFVASLGIKEQRWPHMLILQIKQASRFIFAILTHLGSEVQIKTQTVLFAITFQKELTLRR